MNSEHVSLSSPTPVMSFTSGVYEGLDNPLNYLLKKLPVVDGNDLRILCDFLLKVINISKVGHIQEPTIYELLCPYCKGEMGVLLKQSLTACEKLDLFHARVLRQFVPVRRLSQLRRDMYERVQQHGESLATYVQAVRDAALVLRITETEEQTVGRIVEGLTPVQRARFVFQTAPSTFAHLDQMAVLDRNIAYADSTRRVATSAAVNIVASDDKQSSVKSSHRTISRAPVRGNRPICFYFGNVGHTQRSCSLPSAHRRKPAHANRVPS
jgi:hypothetical protein